MEPDLTWGHSLLVTPFVSVADGAQLQLVFTFADRVVSNRLWFVTRQPPIDSTQLQALADGCTAWYVEEVLPVLSSSLRLELVTATDWTSSTPPPASFTIPGVAGGGSVDSHSANVADRIWFKSAFNGGYIRNSNFVPGIPKDRVSLNTVDTAFRTTVRNAYTDLIDLAAGFGPFPAWRWVCASAWLAGSLRVTQRVLRTDFISYKRPYVAQRRKRLPPD